MVRFTHYPSEQTGHKGFQCCPRCGERLQSDKWLRRKLWCSNCRTVMDRDVAAAVNLSREGTVEVRPFPAQVLGARASR